MIRPALILGLALAVAAFALAWLDFQFLARSLSVEFYTFFIALGFTCLGIWTGWNLTKKPKSKPFAVNRAALKSLGISAREYQVLERLAAGEANKEIARHLEISPNTVKTHVSRLLEKLDARRRTHAIQKARDLHLIP